MCACVEPGNMREKRTGMRFLDLRQAANPAGAEEGIRGLWRNDGPRIRAPAALLLPGNLFCAFRCVWARFGSVPDGLGKEMQNGARALTGKTIIIISQSRWHASGVSNGRGRGGLFLPCISRTDVETRPTKALTQKLKTFQDFFVTSNLTSYA